MVFDRIGRYTYTYTAPRKATTQIHITKSKPPPPQKNDTTTYVPNTSESLAPCAAAADDDGGGTPRLELGVEGLRRERGVVRFPLPSFSSRGMSVRLLSELLLLALLALLGPRPVVVGGLF